MTPPPDLVIRQTAAHDAAALAVLRRAWTGEQAVKPVDDNGFHDEFVQWYEAEAPRRVMFLAEHDGSPVGMMNLTVFERMPLPGRVASRWAYLGNAFVLAAYRNRGVGTALLDAATAHAQERGCVRIVLSPSERSIPFYERAGFGPATMLLARVLDTGAGG